MWFKSRFSKSKRANPLCVDSVAGQYFDGAACASCAAGTCRRGVAGRLAAKGHPHRLLLRTRLRRVLRERSAYVRRADVRADVQGARGARGGDHAAGDWTSSISENHIETLSRLRTHRLDYLGIKHHLVATWSGVAPVSN